jgi:hypothetical protein
MIVSNEYYYICSFDGGDGEFQGYSSKPFVYGDGEPAMGLHMLLSLHKCITSV